MIWYPEDEDHCLERAKTGPSDEHESMISGLILIESSLYCKTETRELHVMQHLTFHRFYLDLYNGKQTF